MMNYKRGNLLSVTDVNSIILHGCNAQGVMGSGVARAVRDMYPGAFEKYCTDIYNGLKLGQMSWYSSANEPVIASGITQEHYGRDIDTRYVSYDAVDDVMCAVFSAAKALNFNVHMPKIGSGLGNGDWTVIEQIIISAAKKCNFPQEKIFIWEL